MRARKFTLRLVLLIEIGSYPGCLRKNSALKNSKRTLCYHVSFRLKKKRDIRIFLREVYVGL